MEIPSTDPTKMVSITTGSAGSYSSTLMFNPLRASDVGMFICRATLGSATNSQSFNVAVRGKCMCAIISVSIIGHDYSVLTQDLVMSGVLQ